MSDGARARRWRRWARQARSAVVVNWPIKLTALVLSTVLWAAVAAEEPTTQLVPVTLIVEPPPGRTLTRALPAVQALYAGSARELIQLYGSPPVARKAIPDTLSGAEYMLELAPGDLRIARDIEATAQDVQPRVITVALDDVVTREVEVVSRVRVSPDTGYALTGGVSLSPRSVTLRGPEAAVRPLERVYTVSRNITGVTAPLRQTVPIDTSGFGVARVTPRTVTVTAEVMPISERVLMGVPVTVRADRGQWTVTPPAVIVTVRGPNGRLVRLTRDSVEVVAVPTGDGTAETVALQAVPPEGLEVVLTPDSVMVERRAGG